jgi:predicted metal-dependent peptidase
MTVDKQQVVESLTTARIALLIKHPFFGSIATRMNLQDASDLDWVKTLATDGRNIKYSPEFIASLGSIGKIEFALGHEILHAVFDHIGRKGDRKNHHLCNIAMDYAVNQILVDEEIGQIIDEVQIYQDDRFREMTWEQIYDILLQEEEDKDSSDEDADTLDQHMDESSDPDSSDSNTNQISKEELEEMREDMKEAILQAAQAASGKAPESIKRLIREMTETKINWQDVIRMNIQSMLRANYSFSRPSRKSGTSGIVLPRRSPRKKVEVAIAIDMSGSITKQDAATFLSEIKGIIQQYNDFKIDLWSFDTSVYNHAQITPNSIDNLNDYEPQGGGGTDFMTNWDYMKENELTPKKFIMFTDGMPFDSWGDPDYCDTIFVVKGNSGVESPFGVTLDYETI